MTHVPAKLFAIAMVISAAAPTAPANAHPTNWSMAGAACVPTGQTASGVGTLNSAGDVGFPAGKIGEIIVTCPVSASILGANNLNVTYRDGDGPGNNVRIIAALRQKNLATGGVLTVRNVQFDSNAFPAVTGFARKSVTLVTCPADFRFDHSLFTYYVQVNIRRATAASQALLASVDLSFVSIC